MKIKNFIIAGIFLFAASCASPGTDNHENQEQATEEHIHQNGTEEHGHEHSSNTEDQGHVHDEDHSQEEFTVGDDSSEAEAGHHPYDDGTEHHNH